MGKAVIFDLDGTLLNTLDDLADSVNHTLNYFKYPKRTKAEVRSFIGGGAKALIKKSLPENVTAEKYEEVLSYFQAYYKKNADKKTGLYPGVKKLVNKLSDENYANSIEDALLSSSIEFEQGEEYKAHIDKIIKEFENENYKSVLYISEKNDKNGNKST